MHISILIPPLLQRRGGGKARIEERGRRMGRGRGELVSL